MRQPSADFGKFLGHFPEIDLPVTLNDEILSVFSEKNPPLSQVNIGEFILPYDPDTDEFTEYIPCFKIPQTHNFHAVVFWKGGLMNYHFTLATYTKEGQMIDARAIAGTYSDGRLLTKSIATIDEDWIILIVSGQNDHASSEYQAASSKTHQLELLPEGTFQAIDQSPETT